MLVSKLIPQVDPYGKIGSAKVSRKKMRKDYTCSLKLAKSQKGNFEQLIQGSVTGATKGAARSLDYSSHWANRPMTNKNEYLQRRVLFSNSLKA